MTEPQTIEPQQPGREASDSGTRSPSRAQRLRRFVRNVLIELAVFAVLYVLSIGPMFWYWYDGLYARGSWFAVAFYEPLRIACRVEVIGEFVNWYVDLWTL